MPKKLIKLEGCTLPTIGFGTYLIRDKDAASAVAKAIEIGYRHIDTAEAYRNEKAIGEAVQKASVERDEMFITTKLWPGNKKWGDAVKDYEGTLAALEKSLERLQLDYVDLYLIHAPFAKELRVEQWRALVDLKAKGTVKAIGVCNYGIPHLEEIKQSGLPLPEINQIEYHPWTQKPALMEYLKNNSIKGMAYSSLVPLSSWRTAPGQKSAKEKESPEDKKDSAVLIKLAKKHSVSEAQVLLRWAVQKGFAVIPKSVNEGRMKDNFDLFSFNLDAAEMNTLNNMDRDYSVAWPAGDPTAVK